jgi:hypothetical protein
MGAVMGYSEQKTVVVLGSEEDVAVFLKASRRSALGRGAAARAHVRAVGGNRLSLARGLPLKTSMWATRFSCAKRGHSSPRALYRCGAQDKRSLKMGLDFGLSLGKKVNRNATVDSETTKKVAEGDSKTRAFTISKCEPPQRH